MVVNTPIKIDTAKMMGRAAIVVNAARPITTSAPMRPAAASPSRRTNMTLSHTTINVDRTTLKWLVISETTERLNKDIVRDAVLHQKNGAAQTTPTP
jgi:hypothetical protein